MGSPAEANQCVPNMLRVLNAARTGGLRVFYALHHRYRPGDYETWKYIAPIQKAAWLRKSFEYGTWGGEIRPGFEQESRSQRPTGFPVEKALEVQVRSAVNSLCFVCTGFNGVAFLC
jgi:hypothetical protein